MAIPARLVSDLTQAVGAAGAGAGLYYFFRTELTKEGDQSPNSLLAALVTAGVGVLGASQLTGPLSDLALGLGHGAMAIAGMRMLQMAKIAPAAYQAAYPVYSGSAYVPYSGGFGRSMTLDI